MVFCGNYFVDYLSLARRDVTLSVLRGGGGVSSW